MCRPYAGRVVAKYTLKDLHAVQASSLLSSTISAGLSSLAGEPAVAVFATAVEHATQTQPSLTFGNGSPRVNPTIQKQTCGRWVASCTNCVL